MRSGLFNNITTRVLILLVTGLLLTTIGSQIYTYLNDRHDTQDAVLCTINEDIAFEGIIVRDESRITYSGNDVISYTYSDGSKVSKGDIIAKAYGSHEAASVDKKIEKLEEQIELLQRAQNPGTTDYVQPESISNKIDEHYKQLLTYTNEGDFEDFSESKNDMSLVMNIYNIISGIDLNFDSKIAQLSAQLTQLSAQADNVKDTVTADETGYFVSYCDGYEDRLNTENVMTLTQSDIEDIINGADSAQQSVSDNAIGKMFTEYTCYITGIIDEDSRVVEDASLQLALDTSDSVYDVTVVSVKAADDNGKIIVVLSCDNLDEALVTQRIQSMQLIFGEYSGIKAPRSAIRFQGEDKGVYVILGENITFKKIDVIYEGDDFVISRNTSDEDYLLLYDQILLEVVTEQDVQASSSSESDVSGSS